jgi:exopolyphosphatase/guanosine-5'-triphosphate,3'-diphosphate pyrophosphatase
MNRLKASIDLGTNTARLLIGSECDGRVVRSHITRRITRLGGGFSKETGISPEAAARTVGALKDFAAALKEFQVTQLRAVATSAVRDAVNRDEFCREVKTETGIQLEVISGEEEGRLTLLGVRSGLDVIADTMLVFDVGGGSTEYTVAQSDRILFTKSLPLGVVRLTEGKGSSAAIADKIARELKLLLEEMDSNGVAPLCNNATLIATAGTATTLAAIDIGLVDYDYSKVNNHLLEISNIRNIFSRLACLTPKERLQQIIGLEEGREDLIIAGTLLTLKSMEIFGSTTLKVSDFGLLEGVLLSLQ